MNGHDSCVLVTGGFDPIHGGHIDYFQDASERQSRRTHNHDIEE